MERIVEKISNFTEDELKRVEGFVNRMNSLKEKEITDARRYTLFPLRDELVWEFYCKQESLTWTAKEFNWAVDRAQFPSLPKRVQDLFCQIFAFFIIGDSVVSENIIRFLNESVEQYEESLFYVKQLDNEATHAESYSLAVVSIIDDEEKRREVLEMPDKLECVKAKTDFIKKYIDSDIHVGLRYLAAALSEGVFFVDLFQIIFSFRDDNYLKTFIELNELIRRDETLHRDFYSLMCKRHLRPEDIDQAYQIVEEAVNIELGHMRYLLREPIRSVEEDAIRGLTKERMEEYTLFIADQVLELAGLPKKYNIEEVNLPWANDMSLSEKSNFYETKSTYKKLDLKTALDWKKRAGIDNGEKKKKIKF